MTTTNNRNIKIAIAVDAAIRAAADYVRANPEIVIEWTIVDLCEAYPLTEEDCAELRAIMRDYNLVAWSAEGLEDRIYGDMPLNSVRLIDMALDRVRSHKPKSDADIEREAAAAAIWIVEIAFEDEMFPMGPAGDRFSAVIDPAMERVR
jgi:hypothetical protein